MFNSRWENYGAEQTRASLSRFLARRIAFCPCEIPLVVSRSNGHTLTVTCCFTAESDSNARSLRFRTYVDAPVLQLSRFRFSPWKTKRGTRFALQIAARSLASPTRLRTHYNIVRRRSRARVRGESRVFVQS